MRFTAVQLLAGIAVVAAIVVWTASAAWPSPALPVGDTLVVTTAYVTRPDTVRRNETLTHLFRRRGLNQADLTRLVRVIRADGLDPRRILPGQVFRFRYAMGDPRPNRVIVRIGNERIVTVARDSAGSWNSASEAIEWAAHLERAEGQILSSLYETLDAMIADSILPRGERDRLIDNLADGVFGWVVDFRRDIYPGDAFRLMFERHKSSLGDVRHGRIVAVELETRGVANSAYVMTDERGRDVYYDAAGRSLRRAFKLSPLSYRRISGRFTTRRFHPILRRNRPHLGIDFAANRGTPVKATANGTVTRAGRWGTYGTVVTIRHARGIETRYAHLQRIASGIKVGRRVEQEQVIGYVGSSGLANGPHLHYEFLKNGRHRDPRKEQRGSGEPVPEARRAEFTAVKARYDRLLTFPTVVLASNAVD